MIYKRLYEKELAKIITELMNKELNLPEIFTDLIEENLVKGNFDTVYDFYLKNKGNINPW